jgi:hypothetical protein
MKPMANRDPRVDRYIEEAAEFARPILRHLREVVHEASPDIEEAIKWGFPNFIYQGIVCSMAAFKAHCAFGFWKEALILPQEERPRNRPWARSVRRRGAGTPAPGMEPAAERAKERPTSASGYAVGRSRSLSDPN